MKEKESNDQQFDQFIHVELDKIKFPFDNQEWGKLRSQLDEHSLGDVMDFQKSVSQRFSWVKWGIITLSIIQLIVILVLLWKNEVLQTPKEENKSIPKIEVPFKNSETQEQSFPSNNTDGKQENNKKILLEENQSNENNSDAIESKKSIPLNSEEEAEQTKSKNEKIVTGIDSLMLTPTQKKMYQDSLKKKKYIIW